VPTVHREAGLTFHFYAGDRGHLPHMHVRGHGAIGRILLVPDIQLEEGHGYTRSQVGKIREIAEANRARWIAAWEAFFSVS
jgi:hypothetical protein